MDHQVLLSQLVRYYDNDTLRERVVMRCVGQVSIGDRDRGVVKLEGSKLILRASRQRPEPVIVDLAPLEKHWIASR